MARLSNVIFTRNINSRMNDEAKEMVMNGNGLDSSMKPFERVRLSLNVCVCEL